MEEKLYNGDSAADNASIGITASEQTAEENAATDISVSVFSAGESGLSGGEAAYEKSDYAPKDANDDSYNMALLEKDLLEAFFPEAKSDSSDEAESSVDQESNEPDYDDHTNDQEPTDSTEAAESAECDEVTTDPAASDLSDIQIDKADTDNEVQEEIYIINETSGEEEPAPKADDDTDSNESDSISPAEDTEEQDAEGDTDVIPADIATDADTEDAHMSEERSGFACAVAEVREEPKKERRIDAFFDIFELFIFSLVAVLVITTFFFRHAVVKGSSMENTLFNDEHLIISDFLYEPKRGDIIVCDDPMTPLPDPIVKRIIAIGGDRVQITYGNDVYVNGTLLVEDYIISDKPAVPNKNHDKIQIDLVVPEGELFVMGDNRLVSTDSRDERIGTISVDSVLGKVLIRFYPLNKFGTVE